MGPHKPTKIKPKFKNKLNQIKKNKTVIEVVFIYRFHVFLDIFQDKNIK